MEIFTGTLLIYQNWRNFNLTVYAGIGTIRLILQKARLADGLDFRIR